MSRGKNNANSSLVSTTNNAAAASTPAVVQHNTTASNANNSSALRRGNKTLAWYISDKILDKNEAEARDSASPLLSTTIRSSITQQQNGGYRKSSVDSQCSLSSNKPNEGALNGHTLLTCSQPQQTEEEKRRKRDRRARPRSSRRNERDYFSIANNTKENNCEEQEEQERQDQERKTSNTPNANSFVSKDRKEDYWYFDPVSDGFYYEFNGSRGWRKRNPKLHGPGGVPLTANAPSAPLKGITEVAEQPQKPLVSAPVATAATAAHQTSKFFPTATAVNVPNIKYYDPASDGFFYEMASIDVSPPSQGQGHQHPHLQQHQQQQRVFRPLQHQQPANLNRLANHLIHQQHTQSHDQMPLHSLKKMGAIQQQQAFGGGRGPAGQPNLTNAELEDMILQSRSSVPLSRGSSSLLLQAAGKRKSTHPVSFASVTQKGMASRATKEDCGHSSSSTTISSSLSDDHCSPPPPTGGPAYSSRAPWTTTNPKNIQRQAVQGVDIGQTQLKQQAIGSFEEPYEFYWSDNEKTSMCSGAMDNKACSVSSTDEIVPAPTHHHHHPTLAAYFNDISLQEQYNEHIQLKRPNSLRLACTPQATATNSQLVQQQQHQQFRAGDKEMHRQAGAVPNQHSYMPFNILSNLSAMRTPMIDTRFSGYEPMNHQDSPLLTPFLLKEENYGWSGGKLGGAVATPHVFPIEPTSRMSTP
uniref:Uncharacterized protein n=1 Tax=Ditylenchus dipsaci TaxID=166011 RepID=A0A915DJJ8_9BILA